MYIAYLSLLSMYLLTLNNLPSQISFNMSKTSSERKRRSLEHRMSEAFGFGLEDYLNADLLEGKARH